MHFKVSKDMLAAAASFALISFEISSPDMWEGRRLSLSQKQETGIFTRTTLRHSIFNTDTAAWTGVLCSGALPAHFTRHQKPPATRPVRPKQQNENRSPRPSLRDYWTNFDDPPYFVLARRFPCQDSCGCHFSGAFPNPGQALSSRALHAACRPQVAVPIARSRLIFEGPLSSSDASRRLRRLLS